MVATTLSDAPWSSGTFDAPSVPQRRRIPSLGTIGLIFVALCAFGTGSGIVFHNLATGHALFGLTEYDDGVYFGTAMHFVAGQLPYRSFVFVQPPGIAILLAPVALIVGPGDPRLGLAIARVLTGTFVGLDALLIVIILRHKGLIAAFTGGMLFAIYPPGYSADRTLMLEPFYVFFCLLSVALAFREGKLASDRRLFYAGLALGFAGAIKLFAGAIVAAFFVVLIWRHRRALRQLAIGAFFGFVVPCLPFFIGAPHGFIQDVFGSQLGRTTAIPTPFWKRIATLVGLMNVATPSDLPLNASSPLPWIGASLLTVISVMGTAIPALRRRATTLTWFAFFGAWLAFAMVCVPQQFYTHYASLSVAFFAIVVGGAVGSLVAGVRTLLARRSEDGGPNAAQLAKRRRLARAFGWIGALTVAAGCATVITIETTYQASRIVHFGDPGRSLDKSIPKGSCVVSDATILLVIANRMNFSSSCPVMVDSTGTWLAYDALHSPQRNRKEPKDPKLVALWQGVFSHTEYAVFAGSNAFRVPFTPQLSQWFNNHFMRVPFAAPITFVRRPHPIANAPAIAGVVP